jgi:hypothetical protein
MSTIRVEKSKDYTIMSNFHLKDKELSLKAKGLLSFMLSLPESWDYSVRGLATILPESDGTIKSTLKELEVTGYLVRDQRVDPQTGKFGKAEYTLYEKPHNNKEVEPWDKNPPAVKPTAENCLTNIYTKKQSTKKESKKEKNIGVSYEEIIDPLVKDPKVKQAIYEFIKMRSMIRKPLTNSALSMILSKLESLSGGNDVSKVKILEQSIINSYSDIFPVNEGKRRNKKAKSEDKIVSIPADPEDIVRDELGNPKVY